MKIFHQHLSETSSTMDVAAELSREMMDDLFVVTTDHQTDGRGRRGRGWQMFAGKSLAMTFGVKDVGLHLPLVASLSVQQVLKAHAPAKIKWPNDVLVGGEKIAGILVEKRGEWHLVGIGVNINTPHDVPTEFEGVTLQQACGEPQNLQQLQRQLIETFAADVKVYQEKGWHAFAESYAAQCSTLGQTVTWRDVTGTAVGLTNEGALVLETANGTKEVHSGEIIADATSC